MPEEASQKGVTLLLAILVMSAITAIVLGTASIVLNETKISGDLIKSQPALTAAEAGTEDGIYKSYRIAKSAVANCSSPATPEVLSNGVRLTVCSSLYYPNPNSFRLNAGASIYFYLYDPTDIDLPPNYRSLTIAVNTGPALEAHFCDFDTDEDDCAAAGDVDSGTARVGTPWSPQDGADIGRIDPARKYQLFISNTGTEPASYTITVENLGSPPHGLPVGTSTLISRASNSGVTRTIQTILP